MEGKTGEEEIGKKGPVPSPIDEYIAGCHASVRPRLRGIAAIVRKEAPKADERISYRMPAFFLGGVVLYFAPFKRHIGIFPPVKGDAALDKALAPYKGPKGNLQLPLDEPMPYGLIRRVVQARVRQLANKAASGTR